MVLPPAADAGRGAGLPEPVYVDDRHCERSEAIQGNTHRDCCSWIASALRASQ